MCPLKMLPWSLLVLGVCLSSARRISDRYHVDVSEQSRTQPKAVTIFTARRELRVSQEEACATAQVGILVVHWC